MKKQIAALALSVCLIMSARAQGTFPSALGPGQMLGNFGSGNGLAAPVNPVPLVSSCPTWLTPLQLVGLGSSAATATLAIWDGSQCVTIGTLGSHAFSIPWPSQSANAVFAGPSSGSAAAPGFRALVFADLPAIASTAEWNGDASQKVLTTDQIRAAGAEQTIAISASTITPNFANGSNFASTLNGAGLTLANPTGWVAFQTGVIRLIQDATGGRTITTWGSAWKFSGGTKPPLSSAANAVDVLTYECTTSTYCLAWFSPAFQ